VSWGGRRGQLGAAPARACGESTACSFQFSQLINAAASRQAGAPYVPVAPPGFYNRGGVKSIGGLEYEVPQSRLYCLCINVAVCSTALQWICRVIRRSFTTMKAHTNYIIFGRPPIGEASPWRRHWYLRTCSWSYSNRVSAAITGRDVPSTYGERYNWHSAAVPCAGRFRRQNINILFK